MGEMRAIPGAGMPSSNSSGSDINVNQRSTAKSFGGEEGEQMSHQTTNTRGVAMKATRNYFPTVSGTNINRLPRFTFRVMRAPTVCLNKVLA